MACLFLKRDELDCAIYVSTGYSYPETRAIIDYAATLLPVHIVEQNRDEQFAAWGIPSDVVPVEWTREGQSMTSPKPVMVQSSFQCCFSNIAQPLFQKTAELGATHLVCGQRTAEGHRAPVQHGAVVNGIIREHPIESWTDRQVLDFLAQHMDIPEHFHFQHSSLDCYDCPAYRRQSIDRLVWTAKAHPDYYRGYIEHTQRIDHALQEALLS